MQKTDALAGHAATAAMVADLQRALGDASRETAAAREREREMVKQAAQSARVGAVLRRGVERTASERDFGRLLEHLLLEVAEVAGSPSSALFLHRVGTSFEPVAVVDEGEIARPERWRRSPLFEGFAKRSGIDADGQFAALLRRDVSDPAPVDVKALWPEAVRYHQARGCRMVWNEPLVLGGEVVGFLGLARTDERPPEPETVEVVRAVVAQIAVAVMLARLADDAREAAVGRERKAAAQKRAAELARANAALQGITARLTEQGGLEGLLGHVLTEASTAVDSRSASLFVFDPASDALAMRTFVHEGQVLDISTDPRFAFWRQSVILDASTRPGWERICKGQHLAGVQGDETSDNALAWNFAIGFHRGMGHKATLCLPLVVGGEVRGFLGLCFPEPPQLAAEKVSLAQALANQAVLALELTRLGEAVRREARQTATEAERSRLAAEVHDTIAQDFIGIIAHLESARQMLAMGNADLAAFSSGVDKAVTAARAGLAESRRSVWALAPAALLSGAGLSGGLKLLVEHLPRSAERPRVHFAATGASQPLPLKVESELLSIAREALGNALRHAGAGARIDVEISFSEAGAVTLRVRDDGCGFAPADNPGAASGHFGLWTMGERAARIGATLEIDTRPGGGTCVSIGLKAATEGGARGEK